MPVAFVRLPRDARLDLLRGLANWAIFLDHIPHELLSWVTLKHYGFSDAADCFVLIAGYTAAAAFGRLMLDEGYVAAFGRAIRRAFQLYAAHIFTVLVFVCVVAAIAHALHDIDDLHQYNVDVFTDTLMTGAIQAMTMEYKPVNLDVLPLYVLLIGGFAPIIPLLGRFPNTTLATSFLTYCAARHWHINLPAYPRGEWYFNPMAWQFLFVIGAWLAVVGRQYLRDMIRSNSLGAIALTYIIFAFLISYPPTRDHVPNVLGAWFLPNDKTYLAPCRILHLLALAVLVVRLLPAGTPVLGWSISEPAIICGRHSLPVFCTGVVLAFLAHVVIELGGNGIAVQLMAGMAGVGVMIAVGYWRSGRAPFVAAPFRTASFDTGKRQ